MSAVQGRNGVKVWFVKAIATMNDKKRTILIEKDSTIKIKFFLLDIA